MNRREKMVAIVRFLEKTYSSEGSTIAGKRWNPFLTLIFCVLSQRTRDANTMKASERLFSVASTPAEIAALQTKKLESMIRPAGTYRQKAARLKKISTILMEKYRGKVPRTREELMALPGVGPKTADVTLCYGHGIPSIAIDTHCNRIPKRIGIVPEKAGPEEVKRILESLTVMKKWCVVNRGLVRFGQDICLPRFPDCHNCPFRRFCALRKGLAVA
jgi:endonuclease-3